MHRSTHLACTAGPLSAEHRVGYRFLEGLASLVGGDQAPAERILASVVRPISAITELVSW